MQAAPTLVPPSLSPPTHWLPLPWPRRCHRRPLATPRAPQCPTTAVIWSQPSTGETLEQRCLTSTMGCFSPLLACGGCVDHLHRLLVPVTHAPAAGPTYGGRRMREGAPRGEAGSPPEQTRRLNVVPPPPPPPPAAPAQAEWHLGERQNPLGSPSRHIQPRTPGPLDPLPAAPGMFTMPENWRQMQPDASAWSRRCLRCNFYCPPCNHCLQAASLCALDVRAGRTQGPGPEQEDTLPGAHPPTPLGPLASGLHREAPTAAGPGQFAVPENWRQMPPDAAAWARRCLWCNFYAPPCNSCLRAANQSAADTRAGRGRANPNARMRRGWIAEAVDGRCPPAADGRLLRGWVAEDDDSD